MNRKLRRDFSGLETVVDRELEKVAASVLGDPTSTAGAIGQTALYMTPGIGSALSVADGVNDIRHGNWRSGLWNLGLGVGTGVADFFSLGLLGSGMRGAAATARAASTTARLARAAKAGKTAGRFGRFADDVVRLGKGAVRGYGRFNNIAGRHWYTSVPNQLFNPIEWVRPSRSARINARTRGLWSDGGVLGGHLGTLMDNGFTDSEGRFDGFTWDKYRRYDKYHDPEYYDRMNRIGARRGAVVGGTRYW